MLVGTRATFRVLPSFRNRTWSGTVTVVSATLAFSARTLGWYTRTSSAVSFKPPCGIYQPAVFPSFARETLSDGMVNVTEVVLWGFFSSLSKLFTATAGSCSDVTVMPKNTTKFGGVVSVSVVADPTEIES